MADPAPVPAPLIWRVPPYQPAILILFGCAAAALNIYGHPSSAVRTATLVLGLAALGFAYAGLRMHLIADDDGVAVRHLFRETWLPWPTVAEVGLVGDVRGAPTMRVTRADGSYVDVPPSLLQPTKPTSKQAARGRLEAVIRQVDERRRAAR